MNTAFLLPAFCLALLTLVVGSWAVVARAKAMYAANIHPQVGQDVVRLRSKLPPEANRIANNYNHLLEQPTLFYLATLALAWLPVATTWDLWLVWGYVTLRAAHSAIQTTVDNVMWRFKLFLASTLLLAVVLVRILWLVCAH